nr:putative late blight resistance protein homolog R1B-16 [Ipomoea trifida]
MRLPSKIWETPKLIRHVEVSSSLSVDPPPPSEVRESLQTLYWLRLHHCTEEVFSRIPNVKKLGIICGGDKGSSSPSEDNLGNLGFLGELKTLMIAFRKGSPTGLQNLKSLPLHLNIKKLKLKRTCLAWSEINIVGMLRNLEVLKLKEASDGSYWNPSLEGDFSKLKFLYVEAKNLVCWEIFEGGQFFCLKHLVLKGCTQLEAIPTGFEDVNTLESVELLNCSLHLKENVQNFNEIREDCYGYNPIIIRHVDQTPEVEEEEEDDLFSYTQYQGPNARATLTAPTQFMADELPTNSPSFFNRYLMSINNIKETPATVPPVPAAATKASSSPPVCSHISGPVPS